MLELTINGKAVAVTAEPDTPLLWVLRDELGLVGSKFGCGMAQCGACTVHLDGEPVRSCSLPISELAGRSITTIEGLDTPAGLAVMEAWEELQVAQCGYCQSGQVMAAAALVAANRNPSDADIDAAMSGNICRCATYARIRPAILGAAKKLEG